MVAATYNTDLNTFELAEGTAWAEATAAGWTSVFAITTGETDDFIQGTQCNSTTVKTGVGALLANFGSGITLNQDDAILIWAKWDVYVSLDTEVNGGIRTIFGDALNSFYGFKHLGKDSYIYDGWINLAMGDPDDAAITPDYTVGGITSGFTKQYAGWAFNALSVPSKGNPYKVDAIRYGRCEIYSINGEAAAYGTFAGAAQENDYNDATNGYNRWGLLRQTSPSNYLHKGLFSFGQTATACDFRDSNRSILIDNTKHVTPEFNKYEVNNASSNVELTSISIAALGSVSKGSFECIDNATVNKDACSFTDMDYFTYLSNSTILNTIYRRCGIVTQGGASITDNTFDAATGTRAVTGTAATLNLLTGNNFTSDGTGYAVDLGTTTDTSTIIWDNIDSGYAAIDGSTGNETIHITYNGASPKTISVATGASTPTVHNDGTGTIIVVAGQVTTTITAKDKDTKAAIEGVAVIIKATDGTGPLPYKDSVTITRVGSVATVAHTAHGIPDGKQVEIEGADQNEYNRAKIITLIDANSYSFEVLGTPTTPATGTITATGILINGLTNASGVVSDTRTLGSDQPITGNAIKGDTAPVYVTSPISDIVDSAIGKSISILMIPD